MKNIICIIDYGCGNTRSIQSSINFLGYKSIISNDNKVIKKSSHIILPGVGSYFNALSKIRLNEKFESIYISNEDKDYFLKNYSSIEIFTGNKGNEIVFIRKK